MTPVRFDIVVPTIGRESLSRLLTSLAEARGPAPCRVILVDDRRVTSSPLPLGTLPKRLRLRVRIVAGAARGPAAARNAGWRVATQEWIAFLDDDVTVEREWLQRLAHDLACLDEGVAASEGRIWVPRASDGAPTDWERNVAGLETARYATADMAYRRRVLAAVGGFDERFPRAYREDADLALRVLGAGFRIARGSRVVLHPVRPAPPSISLRLQRGNADDVLMRALHPGYREGRVTLGKRPWHAATVAAFAGGAAAIVVGAPVVAGTMLVVWAGLTGALAWRRIAPGPHTAREIAAMMVTTIAMPFVACAWWIVGILRLPRLLADAERAPRPLVRGARASSLEAAS
jgi:glycosyl transferase family 2